MHRRRLLLALVTVGLVALALAPAVVTFGVGWLKLPHIQPVGAAPAPDTTPPEAWVLFAVFYLVWMVALSVVLVWSYDRLEYRWHYHERAPRLAKKRRRRMAATLRMLEGQQPARARGAKRPPRGPRPPRTPRPPGPPGAPRPPSGGVGGQR